MSAMTRGSRGRTIVAVVVLTLLIGGAGFAFWPRSGQATPAEATDAHRDHLSARVDGSNPGSEAPVDTSTTVVPPESDSIGNSSEGSLAAAAGSEPATRNRSLEQNVPAPAAPAAPAASAEAAAEPPKRNGAVGLGKPRPDVKPEDVIDPDAALGGCHPAYGEDGQCLPSIPPSQAAHVADMVDAGADPAAMAHPWTCSEVREYFADGIAVRVPGVDPDGLDSDDDGIACEPD